MFDYFGTLLRAKFSGNSKGAYQIQVRLSALVSLSRLDTAVETAPYCEQDTAEKVVAQGSTC